MQPQYGYIILDPSKTPVEGTFAFRALYAEMYAEHMLQTKWQRLVEDGYRIASCEIKIGKLIKMTSSGFVGGWREYLKYINFLVDKFIYID